MKSYERSLITPTLSSEASKVSNDLTNALFKDTYVSNFIDRNNIKKEADLKNQMIDNIIKLLKELGDGFSLVDKEYKLTVGDDD